MKNLGNDLTDGNVNVNNVTSRPQENPVQSKLNRISECQNSST